MLQHFPAARGPGGDKSCALTASGRLSLPHCHALSEPQRPGHSGRPRAWSDVGGASSSSFPGRTRPPLPFPPLLPGSSAAGPRGLDDASCPPEPRALPLAGGSAGHPDAGSRLPAGRPPHLPGRQLPSALSRALGNRSEGGRVTFAVLPTAPKPALGPESRGPSGEPSSLASEEQPRTARDGRQEAPFPPSVGKAVFPERLAMEASLERFYLRHTTFTFSAYTYTVCSLTRGAAWPTLSHLWLLTVPQSQSPPVISAVPASAPVILKNMVTGLGQTRVQRPRPPAQTQVFPLLPHIPAEFLQVFLS